MVLSQCLSTCVHSSCHDCGVNVVTLVCSETQAKDIQDRVARVEKHFGDMCTNFGAYSRKVAKLRDKGELLTMFHCHLRLNHCSSLKKARKL